MVGGQGIHINAVFSQKVQHILCRTDQFGQSMICQRHAQGTEAFGIVRPIRKMQGAQHITHGNHGCGFRHLGAKRQAGLGISFKALCR